MFQTWHPYPPNSSMTAVLNSSNHAWGSVWKLGNFLGVYRYTDSPLSDTAIHMVSSLSPLKITKSSPPKPGFPQQFLRDLVEERPWPTAEETIAVFPSIWGANFGLPKKKSWRNPCQDQEFQGSSKRSPWNRMESSDVDLLRNILLLGYHTGTGAAPSFVQHQQHQSWVCPKNGGCMDTWPCKWGKVWLFPSNLG